jgi:hypothetical protein
MENSPQKSDSSSSIILGFLAGCGCLIAIIVFCSIAFVILSAYGISSYSKEVSSQVSTQKSAEQKSFSSPQAMNTIVTTGDIEWTAVQAKNLGSSIPSKYSYGSDCKSASGNFISVKVKVKNVGSEGITVYAPKMYDADQNSYDPATNLYNCQTDSLIYTEKINPGIEKTLDVIFEMPKTVTEYKLAVYSGHYGDSNTFISIKF